MRIERLFDGAVQRHHLGGELLVQPRLLEQSDPVLAADGSAQREGRVEDLGERRLGPRPAPARRPGR